MNDLLELKCATFFRVLIALCLNFNDQIVIVAHVNTVYKLPEFM